MTITAADMYLGQFDEESPLYRAMTPDAFDVIEASLKQAAPNDTIFLYYILGEYAYKTPMNTTAATIEVKRSVSLYRVKKTMTGRNVVLAPSLEVDIKTEIVPTGYYCLPLMPYVLVEKLDAFFRKVEKLHNTEAIVLLTYDSTFFGSSNPSDGWGCIAPKQQNTAAHCNYDPSSVMESKPDHVYIVGSVHSHPSMAAYFSTTDHDDQQDWEGLHITYGWKPNSLVTEYFIEANIGGTTFPYKPEQIFAPFPKPVVNTDEIEDWLVNVEKKAFTTVTHSSTTYQSTGTGLSSASYGSANYAPGTKNKRPIKLPANAPLPTQNTIIARIGSDEMTPKCPACSIPLSNQLLDQRRCVACATFFVLDDESLADLIKHRAANSRPYQIDIDPDRAPRPIVIWTRDGIADYFTQDLRVSITNAPK